MDKYVTVSSSSPGRSWLASCPRECGGIGPKCPGHLGPAASLLAVHPLTCTWGHSRHMLVCRRLMNPSPAPVLKKTSKMPRRRETGTKKRFSAYWSSLKGSHLILNHETNTFLKWHRVYRKSKEGKNCIVARVHIFFREPKKYQIFFFFLPVEFQDGLHHGKR